MSKTFDSTVWSAQEDQRYWFNQFSLRDKQGFNIEKFREFLGATLYEYFETFPKTSNLGSADGDEMHLNFHFKPHQEMQLFNKFDVKNDHIIDYEEFSGMCEKWLDKICRPSCALVVVDVQNDFIDGSLALINGPAGQDGAEVVPVINNLLRTNFFDTVVYTQDWHPAEHICFHSNLHLHKYKRVENPSTGELLDENKNQAPASEESKQLRYRKMNPDVKVFDTVLFNDGQVVQKLWPTHCVQNSWGAQFHPKLKIVNGAICIQKGTLPHVDAYSAFWDNLKLNETGLRQELLSRNITDVYFCGLALDYCVAFSAMDSARAGFITYVIEDACRGIDTQVIEQRKLELQEVGVIILNSSIITDHMTYQSIGNKGDGNTKKATAPRGFIDLEIVKSICLKRAIS